MRLPRTFALLLAVACSLALIAGRSSMMYLIADNTHTGPSVKRPAASHQEWPRRTGRQGARTVIAGGGVVPGILSTEADTSSDSGIETPPTHQATASPQRDVPTKAHHMESVIAAFESQAAHYRRLQRTPVGRPTQESLSAAASAASAADFAALLRWSHAAYAEPTPHSDAVVAPAGSNAHTPTPPHKALRVIEMKALHRGVYKCVAELPLLFQTKEDEDGNVPEQPTHHDSSNRRTITFVLKTECRPASKWHGQQSYPEVATNALVEMIFGAEGAYGPYARVNGARGIVVEISSAQLTTVVHKDRCGVLGDSLDMVAAELPATAARADGKGDRPGGQSSSSPIFVIGAALQWNPAHRDDAVPNTAVLEYFQFHHRRRASASKGASAAAAALGALHHAKKDGGSSSALHHPALAADAAEREALCQMTDILAVDYLVSSVDRTDRNWFRVAGAVPSAASDKVSFARSRDDAPLFNISYAFPSPAERQRAPAAVRGAQRRSVQNEKDSRSTHKADLTTRNSRFYQMDNGWAFSGRDYGGSVCGIEEDALQCPPILQYLSRSPRCKLSSSLRKASAGGAAPVAVDVSLTACRMRRTTAAALVDLAQMWSLETNASIASVGGLQESDPLTHPQTATGNTMGAEWGRRLRTDPLMRFLLRRFGAAPDTYGGQPDNRGGAQSPFNVALARFTTDCPRVSGAGGGGGDAVDLLAFGVGRRLAAIVQHLSACIDTFGEDEVLL